MSGAANGGSSGTGGDIASKSPFTNHPPSVATAKTNTDHTNDSSMDPMVAAATHYLAQGSNWLLWLMVLLIVLFLMVLEIRRRMDARAKRKARLGMNMD
jgi:flagellar biosynthesis/type III secretory pathway M-ring protein FliF/YscJ